jgi:hypothetical protein
MLIKKFLCILIVLWIAGCAHQQVGQKYDYAKFRSENPHSILIVPVINHSVDIDAPNYFLSSISQPIAERGYYVFPVNMVKEVMNDDGLSDADMVHGGDPRRLAQIFGADSVMYISINRWDARYIVLSTTVTVELDYQLKSGKTGEVLWKNKQVIAYSPQNNNSGGNPLASLIASAITAAMEKAAPNYMPLARQANARAIGTAGQGLPAGPYDPQFMKDVTAF